MVVRLDRWIVLLVSLLSACGQHVEHASPTTTSNRARHRCEPYQGEVTRPNFCSYPKDVREFVEKRDGCDHFRGEEAYDKERARFIKKNLKELCVGTDAALAQLMQKYSKQPEIEKMLSEFERNIEPPVQSKNPASS